MKLFPPLISSITGIIFPLRGGICIKMQTKDCVVHRCQCNSYALRATLMFAGGWWGGVGEEGLSPWHCCLRIWPRGGGRFIKRGF